MKQANVEGRTKMMGLVYRLIKVFQYPVAAFKEEVREVLVLTVGVV